MAADIHDLERYRAGCRCAVCRQANRDYMRDYRASRRGLEGPPPQPDSSVTVLPKPVLVDDVVPGPIEQAVLDETARCLVLRVDRHRWRLRVRSHAILMTGGWRRRMRPRRVSCMR